MGREIADFFSIFFHKKSPINRTKNFHAPSQGFYFFHMNFMFFPSILRKMHFSSSQKKIITILHPLKFAILFSVSYFQNMISIDLSLVFSYSNYSPSPQIDGSVMKVVYGFIMSLSILMMYYCMRFIHYSL